MARWSLDDVLKSISRVPKRKSAVILGCQDYNFGGVVPPFLHLGAGLGGTLVNPGSSREDTQDWNLLFSDMGTILGPHFESLSGPRMSIPPLRSYLFPGLELKFGHSTLWKSGFRIEGIASTLFSQTFFFI